MEAAAGIACRAVDFDYGTLPVLRGVDLDVPPGRRLGVVGPSGCGKSTLLLVVAGLLEPVRGEVAVGGHTEPPERLARCALMPQRDLLLPWRTALDNACLPLENAGMRRREARERARPLLARLGLDGFAGARPAELSGGMRQRVAFGRTVLAGKEVLLLDEPFGALDAITRTDLQDWLRAALRETPRTVLLVTHDVEEALVVCGRVAVMSRRPGAVVAELELPASPAAARSDVVALPGFVAARERAIEALR
jgi:ABC-type nitrate/sulfonate/bicarbonate transport system ATPase subunit